MAGGFIFSGGGGNGSNTPITSTYTSTPPTARTLADRFSDVFNVKDFGAVGDGSTDDQPAIQAAVNALIASGCRGEIYFPPAQIIAGDQKYYKVNSSIDLTWLKTASGLASVVIRGCGNASKISGTVNTGFIFAKDNTVYGGYEDNGILTIEKLAIGNGSTTTRTGSILIASNVCVAIRDCTVGGVNGIVLSNGHATDSGQDLFVFTSTVENCAVAGSGKPSKGGSYNTGTGITMSQGCSVIGCDITAFSVGIRCNGKANTITGGRLEVNGTGILTGLNIDGTQCQGGNININGMSFESNDIGIDLSNGGATDVTIQNTTLAANDGYQTTGIKFGAATGGNIGVFNVTVQGGYSGYAIDAPLNSTAGSSGYRTFIGVSALNSWASNRGWNLPSTNPAFAATCINCNNPDIVSTFANLPTGGPYARAAGDRYTISDSPTAASGNFGAIVSAGSSSNQVTLRVQNSLECTKGVISDGGTAAEFVGTVGALFTGQMTTSTAMTVTLLAGYLAAGDTVTGGSGANAISVTIVSGPGGAGSYVTSVNTNATTTAVGCTATSTNLHVTSILQGTISNGDTLSGIAPDGSYPGGSSTPLQDRTIIGAGAGGGVGDYPISSTALRTIAGSDTIITAKIDDGLGGSGTTLTVTAVAKGSIVPGSNLVGAGITAGVTVLAQLTTAIPAAGGGGTGTYLISSPFNIGSESMQTCFFTLASGIPGTVFTPGGTNVGTGSFATGMQLLSIVKPSGLTNLNNRRVLDTSAGGSKFNLVALGGGAATSVFQAPAPMYATQWVIA